MTFTRLRPAGTILAVLTDRYARQLLPGDNIEVRVSRHHHGWWDVERNGSPLHSFPNRDDAGTLCSALQKEIAS